MKALMLLTFGASLVFAHLAAGWKCAAAIFFLAWAINIARHLGRSL